MSAEASGTALPRRSRGRAPRRAKIAISFSRATLSWLAVAAAAALGGMFGGGFWLGRALAPGASGGPELSAAMAEPGGQAGPAPAAERSPGSSTALGAAAPTDPHTASPHAPAPSDPRTGQLGAASSDPRAGGALGAAASDPRQGALAVAPSEPGSGEARGTDEAVSEARSGSAAQPGQAHASALAPSAAGSSGQAAAGSGAAAPEVEIQTEAPKRGHGLQVGAFEDEDEARSFIQDHAAQLGGLEVYLVTSRIEGKGVWHRVRLGRFDDRQAAGAAKARLSAALAKDAIVVGY